LVLEDLGCNTVHVGCSLLGEALAHGDASFFRLELDGTDEAGFFKSDEAVADVLAVRLFGGLHAGSSACLTTVVLTESVDTDLLSHVELVGDRCGASVEPVLILRGQFFMGGSLDVLGPLL